MLKLLYSKNDRNAKMVKLIYQYSLVEQEVLVAIPYRIQAKKYAFDASNLISREMRKRFNQNFKIKCRP